MPTPRTAIRIPPDLREAIDREAKGDRTAFILDACREKLERTASSRPSTKAAATRKVARSATPDAEVNPRFKR